MAVKGAGASWAPEPQPTPLYKEVAPAPPPGVAGVSNSTQFALAYAGLARARDSGCRPPRWSGSRVSVPHRH